MAVDKAPGKKDKLTDAEKKKAEASEQGALQSFLPLGSTCMFFSRRLLVVVQKISLSLSLSDYFVLPNDDLISLTTVTALSGESESGKGGGEESERITPSGKAAKNPDRKSNLHR